MPARNTKTMQLRTYLTFDNLRHQKQVPRHSTWLLDCQVTTALMCLNAVPTARGHGKGMLCGSGWSMAYVKDPLAYLEADGDVRYLAQTRPVRNPLAVKRRKRTSTSAMMIFICLESRDLPNRCGKQW